jgi:hypothetical protein
MLSEYVPSRHQAHLTSQERRRLELCTSREWLTRSPLSDRALSVGRVP